MDEQVVQIAEGVRQRWITFWEQDRSCSRNHRMQQIKKWRWMSVRSIIAQSHSARARIRALKLEVA